MNEEDRKRLLMVQNQAEKGGISPRVLHNWEMIVSGSFYIFQNN